MVANMLKHVEAMCKSAMPTANGHLRRVRQPLVPLSHEPVRWFAVHVGHDVVRQ